MTAGTGLLMPSLDSLIAEQAGHRGALGVLDAAESLHRNLGDAQFVASFAPPLTYHAQCPCGSVFEIRGSQLNVTEQEQAAAAEAVAEMLGRAPTELYARIVARVIAAINHERVSDDYDAIRDWDDAHSYCEDES